MKEIIERVVEPEVSRAIVTPQEVELYSAFQKTYGYWHHAYASRYRSDDITFAEFKEEVRRDVLKQGSNSPVEIIFVKVKA